MVRLSRTSLAGLPAAIRRPGFDPTRLTSGIVHLGIGAFARAHLAAYTQPLLAKEPSWGIQGVSLRHAETRDALRQQDWLYALAERDGSGERIQIMTALTGILVAPEEPRAVITHLAHPTTRIVTITVTEKGYCRDAKTGELDEADPAIGRDLVAPEMPATLPGLIVAGLRARRARDIPPFAVLSCDNLPANGETTRRILARYASRLDPELGRFVEHEVPCPSAMVDRIVPATTEADRARIGAALGVEDAWPVTCEPFRHWVIEDRFPQGRPAWEESGAILVDDVRPYEEMKLRLLNGSHSTIAYLGQLAGWETVADAMADPGLAAHVSALMQEVATTLHLPDGIDLGAYRRSLLERFANPALRHRTAQIAMDGSQKLPQRLLAPAQDLVAAGHTPRRIAFGIGAWLHYLRGRADDGATLRIDDPMAPRLAALATSASDGRGLVDAVFGGSGIVPPALAAAAPFRDAVLDALTLIATKGAKAALWDWNH